MKPDSVDSAGTVFRTKHPGSGAVAIHDEGRVCAVGCWDGRYVFIDGCRINQKKYNNKQKRSSLYSVRLFSTRSFKPLGTLIHHKAGVQTLAFAHARLPPVTGRRYRRHRHHHCHDHDQHERHERHLKPTYNVTPTPQIAAKLQKKPVAQTQKAGSILACQTRVMVAKLVMT